MQNQLSFVDRKNLGLSNQSHRWDLVASRLVKEETAIFFWRSSLFWKTLTFLSLFTFTGTGPSYDERVGQISLEKHQVKFDHKA